MAWGKLEGTFVNDPKWRRLGEMLGVHRAHAAGHVAFLYAWAIEHRPDGDLHDLDDDEIEEAIHWDGPQAALVAALQHPRIGVIEGGRGTRRIHGFAARSASYQAAQRKKEWREKEAARQNIEESGAMSSDSPGTRDGTEDQPVLGQSGDHGKTETKSGTERERRSDGRSEDTLSPDERPHLGSNHPLVQFFEAEYRRLFKGPALSKLERARAAEVIRRCLEAKVKWEDLLAFYAGEKFAFTGHSLDWLRNNFREVINKLAASGPSAADDDPEPQPWDDEWPAWHARQAKRGKP